MKGANRGWGVGKKGVKGVSRFEDVRGRGRQVLRRWRMEGDQQV